MSLRGTHDELVTLVRELADCLEGEIEARYRETRDHPAMLTRYHRDLEPIHRARALLARIT